MRKINKVLFLAVPIVFLAISGLSFGQVEDRANTLTYFFSPGCHKCIATRSSVMPRIERKFKGLVRVEYRDVEDPENYKLLFSFKQRYAADEKSVFPVLCLNGNFIDGRDTRNLTYDSLARFVADAVAGGNIKIANAQTKDIAGYFKSIGILALLAAGFMDGINPCSFTVIVFFMSYLFLQGYRKRNIAITGLTFIFTVFVTYLLIGVGLFGSLYAIKGFWNLLTVINVVIGLLSITLGAFSLYDAFMYRKTGNAESMVLRLPKYMKDRIHSVVGQHYRADREKAASAGGVKVALSAVAAGFFISIFESICTGQLYLPTIVYILKTSPYKGIAFSYLLLYNLAFIAPLIIVFCLAISGVTSQGFSDMLKKKMLIIKILLAILFICFGVTLVRADNTVSTKEAERIKKQDPYFWDFGRITEGAILKHAFALKNDSTNPVKIKQVNTSCGCTTTNIKKWVIPPGESSDIEVEFDTKGYPGPKSRYIFVHTDDPKNPTVFLQIRADIIEKKKR